MPTAQLTKREREIAAHAVKQYLSERGRNGGKALTQEQHAAAGKEGGKARARKLTAKRRREIAQRAARARWEK